MRIDSTGGFLWSRRYDSLTMIRNILETPDGGFAFLSSRYDSIFSMMITKTDSIGQVQWSRGYRSTLRCTALRIRLAQDGGFLLTGDRTSVGSYWDAFFMKTDSAGNPLLHMLCRCANQTTFFEVLEMADGGYVLGGQVWSTSVPVTCGPILIRTDNAGTPVWAKYYMVQGSDCQSLFRLLQTPDSGFALAGIDYDWGTYLIRTDDTGQFLWSREFFQISFNGNVNHATGLNGDFYFSGYDQNNIHAIKVDSSGALLWSRAFGLPGGAFELAHNICSTMDGGFAIIGSTGYHHVSAPDTYDLYLVRSGPLVTSACPDTVTYASGTPTISTGPCTVSSPPMTVTVDTVLITSTSVQWTPTPICLPVGIKESGWSSFQVFPNPSAGSFQIQFRMALNCTVEIFNLLGERVFYSELQNRMDSNITLGNPASGIYLIRISNEQGVSSKKLVVR